MKFSKFIYIFLFCFCYGFNPVKAQYVTIPDSNFAIFLNGHYQGCMNGNQMDTTCSLIVFEDYMSLPPYPILDLTGIQYFDNLEYLICRGLQLNFLSDLPGSLKILDCGDNLLTSLPILPSSLQTLDCGGNLLTFLPVLPSSLQVLNCDGNLLTSLPSLPGSLQNLDCRWNQLTSLPLLPFYLQELDCLGNDLSSIPALPDSLKHFNCSLNQLTSLPALPGFLASLICTHNQLTAIPALSDSLKGLYCYNNQLTSLPALPGSLEVLRCSDNPLTSLPTLPVSLEILWCDNNQLASLPALPGFLASLHCTHNQLTSLPSLPSSLKDIYCFDNQLTSLPTLPDTLHRFEAENNPMLSCIYGLKVFTGFHSNWSISNTGITCLPNLIHHSGSIPAIDTIPICDVLNPNGCPVGWSMSGSVMTDHDTNCLTNDGTGIQNAKVKLYDGGINLLQQFSANWNGQYSFDVDTGSYYVAVDTTNLPYDVLCPAGTSYAVSLTSADSTKGNLDFKLVCKPGFDIGVQSIAVDSGVIRPANFARVKAMAGDVSTLYNLNCASGISGDVKVVMSGPASYAGVAAGALVPAVNNDTLIYSIADFGAVNINSDFKILIYTDTTAQIGDQVCFDVIVNPVSGDNNPSNNLYTHCINVVNSFDPNDKQVYPSGIIDTTLEWLTYTIRFQNTGNAPAQHIYIMDTLDLKIDAGSFQLLTYSHEPVIQITGSIMKISFPGVNLPDSVSNEPGSHGYIQYKVKLKKNLPLGTEIENTAYIYFDFNSPIQTNTVTNIIDVISSVSAIEATSPLHIYPNPVNSGGVLNLVSKEKLNGRLSLVDIMGRVVYSSKAVQLPGPIVLPSLTSGIYQIMVETANGNLNSRIVVH